MRPPYYCEEDNKAIIDCYGIYVSSMQWWLQKVHKRLNRTAQKTLDEIRKGYEEDGPAILLWPELIQKIPHMIIQGVPKHVRELIYSGNKPHYTSLKLVLLHEIGHHVFPVHKEIRSSILAESLANWFAYGFLDQRERYFLHEKTRQQNMIYHMYNGILSLYYPSVTNEKCQEAESVCIQNGPQLSASIMRRAFSGTLFDSASRYDFDNILDEAIKKLEYDVNGCSQISVHPAELYALMILREIYDLPLLKDLIRGLLKMISRGAITKKPERDWYEWASLYNPVVDYQ